MPVLPARGALTEDPAHYVLECPGYGDIRPSYTSISEAAAAAVVTQDAQQAMLQLFVPENFQELAGYLRRAYTRRFGGGGPEVLCTAATAHRLAELAAAAGTIDPNNRVSSDGSSSDDDCDCGNSTDEP